ncbi:MAG TPA: outer membrane beta-barrel protein [Candidatus Acidoferrum sp.]|nr:outer membrane beta-barrel protein [Candidatus Acidoferrum sp.]
MRALKHVEKLLLIPFAALLLAIIFSNRLLADDKDANNSPAKSAPVKNDASKIESSAPLTERERWMLDRMEQLEKRVAELEAKNDPATAKASETTAAEPAPAKAMETAAAQPSTTQPAPASAASAAPAAANVVNPAAAVASMKSQEQMSATKPEKAEPFAFADFTWLNGNARTKELAMDTKFFTPEIRSDVDYIYDFNHPKDNTISGSSEVFRANEVQVTQLGVGGDFHYDNVRARLMTQFGMYSQTTPRNDASPARGQWNLADAYRYISEAYGGYHFNALHGINVDAGIFMSYVGLFSYYQFDNWAYQPSYVSSNTPWFFNGVRVQIFPTEHLKIEPWFTNGWQSYGRFNSRPGLGFQILWRPNVWLSVLGNQYALGEDALNTPGRVRYHTDDSIEIKYYDDKEKFLDKAAFSLTGDMGCEHGGGVSCAGGSAKGPKQSFLGYMLYNRFWFDNDKYGLTLGGGQINNPGRYLVLLPPINGATAASGTPYFTENPGDPYKAWDVSGTFDWMPSQYITFRWEYNHRAANVPYFSGSGGVTPPGGNNNAPGSFVCLSGFTTCNGSPANTWFPDLHKTENRLNMAILVKF